MLLVFQLRGMYLARQLSFSGVSFKIEEVPLSSEFEKMYNESVALVSLRLIFNFILTVFLLSPLNYFWAYRTSFNNVRL